MTTLNNVPHVRSRGALALAAAGAVLCGVGVAAQARVNGEFAVQLGDPVLAATISFGVGLVIMVAVLLLVPAGRAGVARIASKLRERSIPWPYVLGGVGGAYLVLTQGLVSSVLGVALFSVAVVAGQTISGLVIDRRGLGSVAPKPVTALRLVGAALALGAVIFAGSSQLRGGVPWWMLLLPFIAGIGIALQQAVNGQVRLESGSAAAATFINFVVGTVALLIALLVHAAWTGWPQAFPTDPVLYLGGVIGVIFIALAVVVVPVTGVLLLAVGTIAGQLLASIALDLVIPAEGHALTIQTVVGTVVTLIAVLLVALSSRPRHNTVR